MPVKKVGTELANVLGINATILSITTFTNLELILKILLLIITIIYTVDKYLYHRKRRKKE